VAGTPAAIELFIDTVSRFPIIDTSRTGVTTMPGRQAPRLSDGTGTLTGLCCENDWG